MKYKDFQSKYMISDESRRLLMVLEFISERATDFISGKIDKRAFLYDLDGLQLLDGIDSLSDELSQLIDTATSLFADDITMDPINDSRYDLLAKWCLDINKKSRGL